MNIKYLLGCVFITPLLPIMYLQARRIKARIPNLPEAAGTEGVVSNGFNKTLRMITIGESTVAGVGVKTHQEGFTGTFANELAYEFDANVTWKVYAKSGYTTNKVRREILPLIKENKVDLIVIGLGGNDAFTLNSPWRWRRHIQALIDELRVKFPNTPIAFSNMPPIREFPAFTPLMQFTFGNMVEILGDELKDLVRGQSGVYYYPQKITLEDWENRLGIKAQLEEYFSDGVHPSKMTYQILAKDLATFVFEQKDFRERLENLVSITPID